MQKSAEEPEGEIAALRRRLSMLSEASLRINESLDFETVLQEVLDSARSLTGSRYGVITLLDDAGRIRDFVYSGLTPEESRQFMELPDGMRFFEYLSNIREPLRLQDFQSYIRSLGLPEFRPPMTVSSPLPFLAAPVRHRGESVGAIYVGEREEEFTQEDEETLVMFASQAALVIANARRHREEQRARADLEALVNTAPVGVLVFDARTGVPVSVNREARRIANDLGMPGVTAEQLLEVVTFRRADGREISPAEFPLSQALSAGETTRAEEVVIRAPNGRSVTTLVNATSILSEEGEPESVVVTVQDMTPLEELERLRAEFLGMVSHELRTPLTSIKGSADTLLEESAKLDPAEMRQFHRIIRDQTVRMRGLISDLLDVARIETGTLPVDPPVTALVDEARNLFLSGGQGRDNLHIDLAPDLPRVTADRRRIVQVLDNLLSNAARYSPTDSAIRLAAMREGVHVAVSVADNGRGVPAERLPQLFRKFSRLDGEELERDPGGSGLGLAICKGIVEAHGGRIWAESGGEGLGTRFTFTIPALEENPASAAPPSSRRRRAQQTERERVLVVDDDPGALRYVRDALTKAGYTPIVTGDPEEVPALMEAHSPHLVLLDLVFPGADGIELMRDILKKKDVPIIFLSVYGQDETIARAFDLGAADYVVKPFSPTELAARIRAALRRRALPERPEPSEPYVVGELTVDFARRRAVLGGRTLPLTTLEHRLLVELALYAGEPVAYEHLLERIWGPAHSGDPRPVRTVVKSLRRKLGDAADNPAYVFTELGVGYFLAKGE